MTDALRSLLTGEEAVLEEDQRISLHGVGGLVGEMAATDVPLAPGVNLDALLDGNEGEPRQVVVKVSAGKSKRGWRYLSTALDKFAGEVMRGGLPGYEGHQDPEKVSYEFRYPVTHWVGAKREGDHFYFRGVMDGETAKTLKRMIKSGRINQVSIFGIMHRRRNPATGETEVYDAEPISIDWTPLNRAGMATQLVYAGEMDRLLGEGEEPVGETDDTTPKGGSIVDKLEDLLKNLRAIGAGPSVVMKAMGWTPKQVIGEMEGLDLATLAGEVDADAWKQREDAVALVGEVRSTLGLDEKATGEQITEKVKALAEAHKDDETKSFEGRRDKIIGEMVANEKARPLIQSLLVVDESADDTKIKGELEELLKKDHVKTALQGFGMTPPPSGAGSASPGSGSGDGQMASGLRTKTARI